MHEENPPDAEVERWLKVLGVESLCQWDVLVFLCRHGASLVSAEHIARLLGYETGAVVAALDSLELLGLVDRSRVDQGVRLYQFAAPEDTGRDDTLGRLLTLADSRARRLLLTNKLRCGDSSTPNNGPSRSQNRGSTTWLKAI
jgi:DNA-binding transcriptional ArsR family regulator